MKRPLGSTDVPCSGAGLLPGLLSPRCHRCSHKEKDEHRGQQHAATGTACPAVSHPAAWHRRQTLGGRSKAKSPRTDPSPMPSGACSSPKSVPARPGVSLGAARFGDSSCCYLEPSAGTPHGSPSNLVSVKEQKQHLHLCSLSPWEAETCPHCSAVSLLLKTL